jgi:hypothetical protein
MPSRSLAGSLSSVTLDGMSRASSVIPRQSSIVQRSIVRLGLPRRFGITRWLGIGALAIAVWSGAPPAFADEPAQVTFSGFQRGSAGDGTLFVHVSHRTEFAINGNGSRVTVRLAGASIDVRNNRHPLDLTHFDVLLLSSRLVVVGADVELQLELRHPAKLAPAWVERKDGVVSLHVPIPAQ